jgi:hypothetical protein
MQVELFFSLEQVPTQVEEEAKKIFRTGASLECLHLPSGSKLSYDADCGMFRKWFGNESFEAIQLFLDANSIMPGTIRLYEGSAYLDSDAIKPPRGLYRRGESQAEVDSYVESKFHGAVSVWRFNVEGTNLKSVFDLYHLIRSGKVQPTEWWDVKPAEVSQ